MCVLGGASSRITSLAHVIASVTPTWSDCDSDVIFSGLTQISSLTVVDISVSATLAMTGVASLSSKTVSSSVSLIGLESLSAKIVSFPGVILL